MPNTLWLWVFGLCPRKDFSLSNASRWVALKQQKPYSNSEQPPIYGVGGGLFIATRQPDLICPKWPWVTKELTRVPTVRFQTHTTTLLGLQAKLTCPTLDKIRSHSLHSKTYVLVKHHFSHSDWFSWTLLNSTVVPMTQQRRKRTTKDLSLRAPKASCGVFSCHSLQCEYLHIPPLTSMSSYIFRGHLW